MSIKQTPVTIVTGFLGSGKTTLLNRMLVENHGKKIAVILNEIGDVNIDSELVVQSLSEELKIMNNGCVCCTVREDLAKICKNLVKNKISFDHLVVETTGMADPSPVAQTFFMDESLAKHFYLDAIVTVVDAKHLDKNLSEMDQTQDQIGFADVVLINKTDLVSASECAEVEKKINHLNSLARIFKTERSNVPIGDILGIKAFDLNSRVEINPHLTQGYHHHHHDHSVQSIYLEIDSPLDLEKVNTFMQLIVNELGGQLLRYKGILNIQGEPNRVVFQGVHMNMGSSEDRPWNPDEDRKTKMVFIGRHLPKEALQEGLRLCSING